MRNCLEMVKFIKVLIHFNQFKTYFNNNLHQFDILISLPVTRKFCQFYDNYNYIENNEHSEIPHQQIIDSIVM